MYPAGILSLTYFWWEQQQQQQEGKNRYILLMGAAAAAGADKGTIGLGFSAAFARMSFGCSDVPLLRSKNYVVVL